MTENQEKRKTILLQLDKFFNAHGFTRKVETYVKESEKGLFHVIELRLSPSWSIFSNHIILEFGIFSLEWNEYLKGGDIPKKIRTCDCEIRDVYCSMLKFENNQNWFDLMQPLDKVADSIEKILQSTILPYMNQLTCRADIIDGYLKNGEIIGLPPRHKLSIGILYLGLGDFEKAIEIIEGAYREKSENEFYRKVYESVMAKY
jgi:tetratricopeptide (TPR) repeat protein